MTSVVVTELGQPSFSWKAYIQGGSIGSSVCFLHTTLLTIAFTAMLCRFVILTTQVINKLSIVSAFNQ